MNSRTDIGAIFEFLSPKELETLTGYEKPSKQAQWLAEHNWRYIENAKGAPIVSRQHCRRMMGGIEEPDPSPPKRHQHNFQALLA